MDYEYYNKHYLKTRDDGAIVDAWSDGSLRVKPTDGAVCFNERGGYQLRLTVDGQLTEENPPLWTEDGIPLYKWDGAAVLPRRLEEIEADRAAIPSAPPTEMEQVRADVDFILAMEGWS